MAIFPFILVDHPESKYNAVLINHEKIHLRQQIELLIIFFYIAYLTQYLWGLWRFRNQYIAYRAISFEREAFCHENDFDYLKTRPFWNFRYFYQKK